MRVELTANVTIPVERILDMDRADFLREVESALGSPVPVDALNYKLVGTYGRQELTFAVKGTVDEDVLNEAMSAAG